MNFQRDTSQRCNTAGLDSTPPQKAHILVSMLTGPTIHAQLSDQSAHNERMPDAPPQICAQNLISN